MKSLKNIPASVRQRLLNLAREGRRPFDELVQYYAMERFLYRLSQSVHADKFVLKGALMLRVWGSPEFRPTMDIDMLGKTHNEEGHVVSQIRDVLAVKVEEDGLIFNADSIEVEQITGKADYEGIRIRFQCLLDVMRIKMQIDIGFGDVIYPAPEELDLPTMLNFPPPRLLCYSRESSIAEKFEAMVKLGMLNSRMKDFYDIWLLSRYFDFIGLALAEAIRQTFDRRGTAFPSEIEAFDKSFSDVKQAQWSAFRKRLRQDHIPASFGEIITLVDRFLGPIIMSITIGRPIPTIWKAPGLRWD